MKPAALHREQGWLDRLVSPCEVLGRSGMTLVTAAGLGLSLLVSRFGIRFDGFLDLHRMPGEASVPVLTTVADQLVALPLSAAVAWLALRAFGAAPSFPLLVIVFGVARLPLVLAAPVILLAPDPAILAEGPVAPTPGMLTVGLVSVVAFAWMITLLVTGVRFAAGLQGGRLAAAVLLVVISAEVVSKLALVLLG